MLTTHKQQHMVTKYGGADVGVGGDQSSIADAVFAIGPFAKAENDPYDVFYVRVVGSGFDMRVAGDRVLLERGGELMEHNFSDVVDGFSDFECLVKTMMPLHWVHPRDQVRVHAYAVQSGSFTLEKFRGRKPLSGVSDNFDYLLRFVNALKFKEALEIVAEDLGVASVVDGDESFVAECGAESVVGSESPEEPQSVDLVTDLGLVYVNPVSAAVDRFVGSDLYATRVLSGMSAVRGSSRLVDADDPGGYRGMFIAGVLSESGVRVGRCWLDLLTSDALNAYKIAVLSDLSASSFPDDLDEKHFDDLNALDPGYFREKVFVTVEGKFLHVSVRRFSLFSLQMPGYVFLRCLPLVDFENFGEYDVRLILGSVVSILGHYPLLEDGARSVLAERIERVYPELVGVVVHRDELLDRYFSGWLDGVAPVCRLASSFSGFAKL